MHRLLNFAAAAVFAFRFGSGTLILSSSVLFLATKLLVLLRLAVLLIELAFGD